MPEHDSARSPINIFDVMFRFAPTSATLAGFHEYDPKLENDSRAGVDAEIAALKEFEWKFDDFREAGLDESTKADLAIMRSQVRGNLLELETIRPWEKNPTPTPAVLRTAPLFSWSGRLRRRMNGCVR